MPREPTLVPAVRSETAAPYAVPGAAPSQTQTLLARIERTEPAALDDHQLLGLVGIDVDFATLAAAGGLRELLDDPDDTLRTFLLPAEDRARVHALHELHARWMESRLRRDGALISPTHMRRYIEARLRGLRNEVFGVIHLDHRYHSGAFVPRSTDTLQTRTSGVVLENSGVFGSDYLRMEPSLGSHYLRMSADYLRRAHLVENDAGCPPDAA